MIFQSSQGPPKTELRIRHGKKKKKKSVTEFIQGTLTLICRQFVTLLKTENFNLTFEDRV